MIPLGLNSSIAAMMTPKIRSEAPLGSVTVKNRTCTVFSAADSHELSRLMASPRKTGSRVRIGTHSMTARWFGSPVSAFGRNTVEPPIAP